MSFFNNSDTINSTTERKNLVILSWSIILFTLTEGNIEGNKITLPLINIEFSNMENLLYLVWIMLCWFLLRFWQTHKMIFLNKTVEYIQANYDEKFIDSYIENELNIKIDPNGNNITDVSYKYKNIIWFNQKDEMSTFGESEHQTIQMSGVDFQLFNLKNHLKAYLYSDAITVYFMPYIFAFFAIYLNL